MRGKAMKKTIQWFGIVAVIAAAFALAVPALPQNPQTQTAPIYAVNAKYTNGTAPGYWATQQAVGSQPIASGLNINVGPGTVNCGSGTIIQYAGGTFALTASATNRIYLNTASSCAPAVKTSAFAAIDIPIAVVVTSGSAITSVVDDRTPFGVPPSTGVAWGAITGTLTDQLDLAAALAAKAAASSSTTINGVLCALNGSCTVSASSSSFTLPLSNLNEGTGMLHLTDSTGPGGVLTVPGAPANGSGTFDCPGPSSANVGQTYQRTDVTPYQYFNCGSSNVWVEGTPFNSTTERLFVNYNQQSSKPGISGDYPYAGSRYSNNSGIINTGNAACMDVFNIELYPWEAPADNKQQTYFHQCGVGDYFNWSNSLGWGHTADAPTEVAGVITAAVMYDGTPLHGKIPAQSTSGVVTSGTWTNTDPTVTTTTGTFSSSSTAVTVASGSGISQYFQVADTTNPSAIPAGTYVESITGTAVTLSANTAAAGSGDTLTFTNQSVSPFRAGYAKCGSSGSLTFTTMPAKGSVYLAWIISGSPLGTDTATLTIDGVSQGTISSGAGNTFSTVHSTKAWWGQRFALTGTTSVPHTIVITPTSGTFCPLMVVTPEPASWGGMSLPKVVQELMPPVGNGWNNLDQLIYAAQASTIKQMKADGFNVESADFWKGWPESKGGSGYFEHNIGTYPNGLTSFYSAAPHFNNLGSVLNGDTFLQAAKRIPYSAPDVEPGSSGTVLVSRTQSGIQLDVDTSSKFDMLQQANTHSNGTQQVFSGNYQTPNRVDSATGNPTPVTIVQSGSFNSTTATMTLTAGHGFFAIIERSSSATMTSSNVGDTIVQTLLGTTGSQTVNLYMVKSVVGGSTTFTLSGSPTAGGWFEVSNLNQVLSVESTLPFSTVTSSTTFPVSSELLTLTEPSDLLIGFTDNTCSLLGNTTASAPWMVPAGMNTSLPAASGTGIRLWTGSLTTNLGPNAFTLDPRPNCLTTNLGTRFYGLVAIRSTIANAQTADIYTLKDENQVVLGGWNHAGVPYGSVAASGATHGTVLPLSPNGVAATPSGLYQTSPFTYLMAACSFTTTTSDPTTDLVIAVKFNGSSILSGSSATITHGASAGSITSLTLSGAPPITAGQNFELDVVSGTSLWTGVVSCHS
jgi:hypothetical protein